MPVVASPSAPLFGTEVTLSITNAVGTAAAFELVAKPATSALTTGVLLKETASDTAVPLSPLIAVNDDVASDTFVPDKPGEYEFIGYDLAVIDSLPAFEGDPVGDHRFELVHKQRNIVTVGANVDLLVITDDGHGGKIRMQVNGSTIVAVTIIETTTERARVAALHAAVVNGLNAMVGFTIQAVGTRLQDGVNSLRDAYEAHRLDAVHDAAGLNFDTVNRVVHTRAHSNEGAIVLLNDIRAELLNHMFDGSSSANNWHASSGVAQDDLKNVPVVGSASDLASATVLSADLRFRVYNHHRTQAIGAPPPFDQPACHLLGDNNTIDPPSMLDLAIVLFLNSIAAIDPSVVAGEGEGIIDAGHLYGFVLAT